MSSGSPSDHSLSSQQKRELLAQLVRQMASPATTSDRLSHGQAALWFAHQLAPQSWTYHVVFSVRIRSAVDESIMRQALQFLLDRHAILRTTYSACDGVPASCVHPQMPVDFDVIPVPTGRWEDNRERFFADVREPFDLERGPILRARLYRQSHEDYTLMLAIHHIAVDFWSLGILLQEFRVAYAALRAGQPVPLPPLWVTYDHYVRQQTDMLAGPEGARLRAYWLKQLSGELPVLALPLDRPRPMVQTYLGASHAFQLSSQLTAALNALAQREGVTLYMILLAALQILLHRYSGQTDIWVGSPMACRNRPSFRPLVGYCANPVVMRANLSGNPTFRGFLSQVRRTVLEALRHADYPFSLLVEHLQPQRDASRSPLFQVTLVLQTLAQEPALLPCLMPAGSRPQPIDFGDLILEPDPLPHQEGLFDLGFEMAELGSSICGYLKYNSDLFDLATIARLARHFTTLLEGLVVQPDEAVETLPLLTAAERHQILDVWQATETAYPRQATIPQVFEAQVQRAPEALAVVFEEERLTYRALNDRANQLAHDLQARGIGPGTLVGLCMERSPDMVVGVLGILKAGAAYVPLDPSYPEARLAFMVEDSRVPLILTQSHLQAPLPARHVERVCLDGIEATLAQASSANPPCRISAEDAAYVMYTSGSTGRPKGIIVPHRAVNRLVCQTNYIDLGPDDRVALASNPAFDAATFELWGALLNGARLVVLPRGVTWSAPALAAAIAQHGINTLFLTTALFNQLARERPELFGALDNLLFGGEMSDARWVRQVLRHGPPTRLLHVYGPTENTAFTTWHLVDSLAEEAVTVPIGRPIANTQVYILSPFLQPVPPGVPGELYIGGDGLAQGYHNRLELTQNAFIRHPFGAGRLYKTGDLARFQANGRIDFLGRADHQVKICGYRIELSEIETVLLENPEVKDAVVVPRERGAASGHKSLVAYVVTTAPVSALRGWLQQKLPDFMVPATFVILDALPLTLNGKIDRRALPLPEATSHVSPDVIVAPQTPEEARLLPLWCQVLGLDQVSIHDSFFELGGHSLQAMQLVSQVAAELRREMPVHALFLHPTPAALAQVLDTFPPTSQAAYHGVKTRHAAPADKPPMRPSSPFTTFVRSAIFPRIATGDFAPVHAATMAYLPVSLLHLTGASRDLLLGDWCHHRPGVASLLETTWGRIALILLPLWSDDVYRDPDGLTAMALDGLALAGDIGARTVSLAGLLPSATRYGRTLTNALAGRNDRPQVSTGHATTTSAIVLMIGKLLHEGGRHLVQECVGFLGLGSIGLTSLQLMLNVLPHPAEVLLCDVYAKRQALESLAQILRESAGFQGRIRIVTADPEVPAAFYEATLIVGATNVPDILDISRLQPGTMIVDDSAPHCFDPERAVRRFEQHRDLLFTEGGIVRSPQPFRELRYVPRLIEETMTVAQFDTLLIRHDPHEIMGCTLASLLSSRLAQLPPTVGFVDPQTSQRYYGMLKRLGFEAARLQCADYVLTEDARRDFRRQFRAL
jgi:amino acid adenylation domain-containing protein